MASYQKKNTKRHLSLAINCFCITSHVIGTYRAIASEGFIFDLLLGLETGVNLVSDFVLLNALQTQSNPAQNSSPHAEVVMKLRNFLTLNTGTILFCCVTHIGASYFLAQHVHVHGAKNAEEKQTVRNSVFSQLAIYYVILALVKGAILHNIYGFYRDFKDNPPLTNAIVVVNPLANQGQPVVFVNVNPPPPQGVVAVPRQ
ncbi:uncharacterized protein LOC142803042 isoform X2 [Rhipicephalus microplus]|uniref:uncharacterized protein LOC142803042 isoform X2 n=1 Tax=Rhipicephalus microplus TaxID=6941 RepID=UPI003F6A591D